MKVTILNFFSIILLSIFFFCDGNGLFAQFDQQIEIISPDSKKELIIGKREGITWIGKDTSRISIEYSTDDIKWVNIYSNIRADLEYIGWKIPSFLSGERIKIRFLNYKTKELLDKTDFWINVKSNLELSKKSQFLSAETELKILPLGNSITFDNRAGDTRTTQEKTGYRYPLYQHLTENGISFDFIGSEHAGSDSLPSGYDDNAGFPGITSAQLVELLETGVLNMPVYGIVDDTITDGPYLETYIPDIILLHIGTNGNQLSGGDSPDDVEDILDEVDRVETLLGNSIDVIVARIIDRVPNESYVDSLNDNVEDMIMDRIYNPLNTAYPDNLLIADMENGAGLNYTISPDPSGTPGDMNDALHPNDKGYGKMATKWFTAINSVNLNSTDNMISYWQFDESSSTFIDKMNINTPSCVDCPVLVDGMNDSSISFSGTNELIVENNNSINYNLSGSFTVETWIKTTQSGSGNKVFIGKYDGQATWWLGFNTSDSLAVFSVRSSSGVNDNIIVKSSTKINDGNWHHLVAVKDYYNENLILYLDGVKENQEATNYLGEFTGTSDLTIGSLINDFYYNGILDEMAIYDRVLQGSEILSHYSKGLIGQDYCNDSTKSIAIKIFLEGPYVNGEMSSQLSDLDILPLLHPFNNSVWNYSGAEKVSSIPNSDPLNKITDWVLVALREQSVSSSTIVKRAGFLTTNGSIVDLDGVSPLEFPVETGDYYLVVEQINHLKVMSSNKININ